MYEGGRTLAPGRYTVETLDEVTASRSQAGNVVLRIPFKVVDDSEFAGVTAAMYQTILEDQSDPDKYNASQFYLYRVFSALGVTSDEDKGPKGHTAELEFGTEKNQWGGVPVTALIVNGQKRSLGARRAIAIVVADPNRNSGINVDRFEPLPEGERSTPMAASTPGAVPSSGGTDSPKTDNPKNRVPF